MSTQNPTSSVKISAADRLSLTLFLAVVLHGLVILGIGLSSKPQQKKGTPVIEVTLAERPARETPEEYDFLAQADQDGGGESTRAERPQRQAQDFVPGELEGLQAAPAAPAPTPPPQPDQDSLVRAQSQEGALQRTPAPEAAPEATAIDMIDSAPQVARYTTYTEEREARASRQPSKQRIDARTRQHDAVAYLHEWVTRVERVGNLNYPEEARRRELSGQVILEITLRPSGELQQVRILRPSGQRLLDQAAVRTVQMAAPFAPVPAAALEGKDLLTFPRTFEFIGGEAMQAR